MSWADGASIDALLTLGEHLHTTHRRVQIGIDPAVAEEDPTPRYRYNFGYARYGNDMQLMQQIRGSRDIQQLQVSGRGASHCLALQSGHLKAPGSCFGLDLA